MKNAILLCFLFVQFSSSGQTYKVIYEQRESINLPEELSAYKDITECKKYNVRVFEYLVDKSHSSYLFSTSYIDNRACHEAYAGTFPGAAESYYMDFDSNLVFKNSLTLLRDDEFILFHLMDEFKILERETEIKTMLNHLCKGVTVEDKNGKKYKIWYATDIYIPGGPEKFGGLEGLIVSVDFLGGQKSIIAKSITQIYEQEITLPQFNIIMTQEEFLSKMDSKFKQK